MSSENRKRAARSGWARRRGKIPQQPSQAEPGHGGEDERAGRPASEPRVSDHEPLFAAYRAAKAKHDGAAAALRQATRECDPPDPELVRAQTEAAMEEIDALTALNAGVQA